ncbi:MAG: hypothetical protein A2W22_01185 [Candidatus Levybacteria bacterium RBG_16_35_11]|nr:MAG: hypothetical protein A2W22_01185 [Candidatus Levybacteria bacterium RBG_16_35_11]
MKKIFLIPLFLILVFCFSAPVFAANFSQKNVTLPKDEIVNGDFFAGAGNVSVHGTVEGDVYVAGGNVLVDGTINGDLLAAGGTIIIKGNIAHNVRAVGGNVVIDNAKIGGNVTLGSGNVTLADTSEVLGSLVAGAGQVQLLGPIGKEINVAAGKIVVSNSVNGNARVATGNLSLSKSAKIEGDLTYWSNQKLNLSEGATVSGEILQKALPKYDIQEFQKGTAVAFSGFKIFFGIVGFIAAYIIGLLLIYLLPVFTKSVSNVLKKRFWLSFGIGVLGAILTPIIFVVLLISLIGIPIAFIFVFIMILLFYFSKIYVSYVLGEKIFSENQKVSKALILFVGLLAFSIIALIPFIGAIFKTVAVLFGFGALLISERDYLLLLRSKKLV